MKFYPLTYIKYYKILENSLLINTYYLFFSTLEFLSLKILPWAPSAAPVRGCPLNIINRHLKHGLNSLAYFVFIFY